MDQLSIPVGAMTGGSWQGRTAGLLSRKAELNEMETELAEVKRLAEELADQGDQARPGPFRGCRRGLKRSAAAR